MRKSDENGYRYRMVQLICLKVSSCSLMRFENAMNKAAVFYVEQTVTVHIVLFYV